jgi:hypothetical protein
MNHQNSDGSDSAPLGPRGGDVLYGEWGVTVIKKNLRLEVANPYFHLRSGMFVDIELPAPIREGLTILADAIVDTGLVKRVFVEAGEGNFEAREVQTGRALGDRVQIINGLQEGEKVVSSGTFLIDSETRMHPTAGATHITGSSSGAEIMASNGVR